MIKLDFAFEEGKYSELFAIDPSLCLYFHSKGSKAAAGVLGNGFLVKHGTPERAKFDEEAYAFYTSQVLLEARRDARLTQAELAKRIGADKSYISRIEKGSVVPSVATFYRIVGAMGLSVELHPA